MKRSLMALVALLGCVAVLVLATPSQAASAEAPVPAAAEAPAGELLEMSRQQPPDPPKPGDNKKPKRSPGDSRAHDPRIA